MGYGWKHTQMAQLTPQNKKKEKPVWQEKKKRKKKSILGLIRRLLGLLSLTN